MKKRSDRRRRDPRPIIGRAKSIRLRNGRVLHAEDYGLLYFPIRGRRSHWDMGHQRQKQRQPEQLKLNLQPPRRPEPPRARRRTKK